MPTPNPPPDPAPDRMLGGSSLTPPPPEPLQVQPIRGPTLGPTVDLFSDAYALLRDIAAARMADQPDHHTLQPTALVHEAYLRLSKARDRRWNDRGHFLRSAARAMRSVLVDHGRAKGRRKRTPEGREVPLESLQIAFESRAMDLLELDDALERLAQLEPRLAELVELRFFAGCTVDEAAQLMQVSPRQAARDWKFTRHWLYHQLKDESIHGPSPADGDAP